MTSEYAHNPVLLTESIELLHPISGGRFIDCTLGAGGHAEKILELSSPDGTLLAIDADPAALAAAAGRLARFGERVVLVESFFDRLEPVAGERGFDEVDGVLFDLGVSSPQLDTVSRGFSFQQDAPLDMRFGPLAEETAADIVNTRSVEDLQRLFQEYGEEHHARRVARRIVEERRREPIETTGRLAAIVASAKPRERARIHPATRVFQALRIAVNDELGRLRRALPQAVRALRPGGRLVAISFHSLEDRIVKDFMRREAKGCVCPPELPVCVCGQVATLRPLTRRPIRPSAEEVDTNPRARSARLRAAERLETDQTSGGRTE